MVTDNITNISGLRPQKKTVLLQAYEWPVKSEGGIHFPETLQYDHKKGGKDPWRGKVLAIGEEVTQVKAGEIVRYQPGNYWHNTLLQDRVRYILFNENLIYAVEDENEKIIRALKNRVVIEPEDVPVRQGVLYLPENREDKYIRGHVVVAGENTAMESGDRILMENKKTWQYFDSAGKRFLLVDKVSIMAIIDEGLELS